MSHFSKYLHIFLFSNSATLISSPQSFKARGVLTVSCAMSRPFEQTGKAYDPPQNDIFRCIKYIGNTTETSYIEIHL